MLYLDELEWRFNNGDNLYLFRDTLLELIKSENLPYEKLALETKVAKGYLPTLSLISLISTGPLEYE